MKTTSDDARYTVNQLVEAANLLEIQLSNARRLLERTDLPGAFDQLDRAIDAAAEAEADISVSGPLRHADQHRDGHAGKTDERAAR
jgi:hypothetical protein